MTTADNSDQNRQWPPKVRFYLVRHGETEANVKQLVVGQGQSPLTERGVQQAIAFGKTRWIRDTEFWRIYSSDLERAQKTLEYILQSIQAVKETPRTDVRLREVAKGARQEYPKTLTYQEAVEARQKEGRTDQLPLLETEEDGWNRFSEWLDDVIRDVVAQCQPLEKEKSSSPISPVNVLVIAHAGILRGSLARLIGAERLSRHSNARYDKRDGRFYVPNTSVTILEFTPELGDDGVPIPLEKAKPASNVEIIELTRADHLKEKSDIAVTIQELLASR